MAQKAQPHPSARLDGKGTVETGSSSSVNNVNIPTAYLLYFIGGIFGLHHAYLNRPTVGLAWYATSGLFGLGLLRDLIKIPYYVSLCRDDRTNDVSARTRAATVVAREGLPPWSLGRIVLMGFFGTYFGFVASCLIALPRKEEDGSNVNGENELWWTNVVYGLLRAIGSAAGIWLVGNMGDQTILTKPDDDGNQKGEFMGLATWCLASLTLLKSPNLGGIVYAVRRRRYRHTMSPGQTTTSSATKRIGRHLLKCALFTSIMVVAVCNHGSIVVNDNRVYLQDAIRNAIHSGFWKEFDWEQFRQQQQSSSEGGSEYLKKAFDIAGERAARRTLGVARDATHAEVRSAYKKLALKYHPDKIGSDATDREIEEANRQFNKVQEAYDVLNSIEQARKRKEREREENEASGEAAGGGSGSSRSSRTSYRDEM